MSLIGEHFPGHTDTAELRVEASSSFFADHKLLKPSESVHIDCGRTDLYDNNPEFMDDLERLIGEKLPVVAQVGLKNDAGDDFFIINSEESKIYNSPYIILKEEYGSDGMARPVVKGVWPDEEAVVGRSEAHGNRFTHSGEVSNTHFSVSIEPNGLVVKDLESKNGTYVTAFLLGDGENLSDQMYRRNIRDDFTRGFVEKAKAMTGFDDEENNRQESPNGTYKGFSIIGRDSPTVRGGIYGTIKPDSEFVIVNEKSPQIKQMELDLKQWVVEKYGNHLADENIADVLNTVRKMTANRMRYDLEKVDKMSRPHYDSHGLVALTDYMDAGVGVCRHQALLAAVLTEHLIHEQMLPGSVHVERNHDVELHGAHAWAVFEYQDKGREAIIIDPAQDFVGTREDARRQGRWRYYVDASAN